MYTDTNLTGPSATDPTLRAIISHGIRTATEAIQADPAQRAACRAAAALLLDAADQTGRVHKLAVAIYGTLPSAKAFRKEYNAEERENVFANAAYSAAERVQPALYDANTLLSAAFGLTTTTTIRKAYTRPDGAITNRVYFALDCTNRWGEPLATHPGIYDNRHGYKCTRPSLLEYAAGIHVPEHRHPSNRDYGHHRFTSGTLPCFLAEAADDTRGLISYFRGKSPYAEHRTMRYICQEFHHLRAVACRLLELSEQPPAE